jgi:hypothetical protein
VVVHREVHLVKVSKSYCVLTLALALGISSSGMAQDLSLEKCRQVKDQIEHYTQLRRAGGSASKMDRWKRLRADKQAAYDRGDCRKYRGKLR